jgi:hypothetical protein
MGDEPPLHHDIIPWRGHAGQSPPLSVPGTLGGPNSPAVNGPGGRPLGVRASGWLHGSVLDCLPILGALRRRFRCVAILAIVLSPGGAGIVMPAMVPCPMEAPWLETESKLMAGHPGSLGSQHSDSHSCHCVGQCCPSAPATVTAAGMLAIRIPGPTVAQQVCRPTVRAPVQLPADRLPPATAPPQLG